MTGQRVVEQTSSVSKPKIEIVRNSWASDLYIEDTEQSRIFNFFEQQEQPRWQQMVFRQQSSKHHKEPDEGSYTVIVYTDHIC